MGTLKTRVIFTLPSVPTLSFPLQLCTDKTDLFPCQNYITFLRASGLLNPSQVVRKSRDFHREAGLCSGQRQRFCGRSSLGNMAHAFSGEQKRLVKLAAGKIRTSHSCMNKEKIMGEVNEEQQQLWRMLRLLPFSETVPLLGLTQLLSKVGTDAISEQSKSLKQSKKRV